MVHRDGINPFGRIGNSSVNTTLFMMERRLVPGAPSKSGFISNQR
jgi:hypothetical protein